MRIILIYAIKISDMDKVDIIHLECEDKIAGVFTRNGITKISSDKILTRRDGNDFILDFS